MFPHHWPDDQAVWKLQVKYMVRMYRIYVCVVTATDIGTQFNKASFLRSSVTHLVKKSSALYQIQTTFTANYHYFVSRYRSIQSSLPTYFFMLHLNVILISTPRSSTRLPRLRLFYQKCVHILHFFFCQCYEPNPPDFPWFHHYYNTWCTVHITKLHIMQFYPTYSHSSS